jgi:hypothetical protein
LFVALFSPFPSSENTPKVVEMFKLRQTLNKYLQPVCSSLSLVLFYLLLFSACFLVLICFVPQEYEEPLLSRTQEKQLQKELKDGDASPFSPTRTRVNLPSVERVILKTDSFSHVPDNTLKCMLSPPQSALPRFSGCSSLVSQVFSSLLMCWLLLSVGRNERRRSSAHRKAIPSIRFDFLRSFSSSFFDLTIVSSCKILPLRPRLGFRC